LLISNFLLRVEMHMRTKSITDAINPTQSSHWVLIFNRVIVRKAP